MGAIMNISDCRTMRLCRLMDYLKKLELLEFIRDPYQETLDEMNQNEDDDMDDVAMDIGDDAMICKPCPNSNNKNNDIEPMDVDENDDDDGEPGEEETKKNKKTKKKKKRKKKKSDSTKKKKKKKKKKKNLLQKKKKKKKKKK